MRNNRVADKSIKFANNTINNIAIVILVLLILISVYALFDKRQVYEDAKISQDIEALGPKDNDVSFSLDELRKINSEINGWIKINKTNIDYPIVQAEDNVKYLTNNYTGEDTGAGSVFMDYRNANDFSDDYNIIYGHNIDTGLMFGDILKYKKKSFFKKHTKGKLYTLQGQYDVQIFSYNIVDASLDDIYDLTKYKKGQNEYIENFYKKSAISYKDIGVKATDKLLLLSTCDTTGTYKRAVLLAKITPSTDITSTITTKKSKLNEKDQVGEEKPVEKIKKTKEDTKASFELPKISADYLSIYVICLVLSIIVVIIIYSILIGKRVKLKKLIKQKEQKDEENDKKLEDYQKEIETMVEDKKTVVVDDTNQVDDLEII